MCSTPIVGHEWPNDLFAFSNRKQVFTVLRTILCERFFTLDLHYSNPSGTVIHMLKYFRKWFQFCEEFCVCKKTSKDLNASLWWTKVKKMLKLV